MESASVEELAEGKKWIEGLVFEAKNIQIPPQFNYLTRRIYQSRCFDLHNGNPAPSLYKLCIRYLLGIGYITLLILRSRFSSNKIEAPFSIWDSDVDSHGPSEAFNDFIKSEQVISIKNEHFIFIKSINQTKQNEYCKYCNDPIYEAILFLNLSWGDGFELIWRELKNFLLYLKVARTCPGTNRLFKDFLLEPLINLYQRKGMQKFYRTNSNINSQEFWCESIDFNTVWYSINSRNIQFKNSPIGPNLEYPLFYFMYLGTSWSWNDVHAEWLNSFYKHKVNIVGPIIFQPKKIKKELFSEKKRLLIFDVTPFQEDYIRGGHYKRGLNFYNETYCLKFIKNVLAAVGDCGWEIFLKPKREYIPLHSQKYVDFIIECKNVNPNFKLLSPATNLFDEIEKADLVITIPLSSPFDIAKSTNIPSLYFDPSGEIDFESMGYCSEDYLYTVESLRKRIIKINEGKKSNEY